jgi:type VI secretion system protein
LEPHGEILPRTDEGERMKPSFFDSGMRQGKRRHVWIKSCAALTWSCVFLAAMLMWCSGCSKVKSTAKGVANRALLRPSPTGLDVGIDPDANSNSPVALDVVLIKDKNFWKAAPAMSAKDWFAQKDELTRRYGAKLQVSSWEWVPDQHIGPIQVKVPRRLSGAMVFANYPSPGTHSAPLPLGKKISIALQKDDFTMKAEK